VAADENDCFARPYPFANDHARFLYLRHAGSNLLFVPHEEYRCTVTMTAGLPGSGKDTWLMNKRPGLPVVSLDDIRDELGVDAADDQGGVIQLARDRCRELLRGRRSFAFNATNLIRQTRQRWIDLFGDYGARIEITYVEPPLQRIMRQNKERARAVPESVILHLAAKCEPPTWAETHTWSSAPSSDGRAGPGGPGHPARPVRRVLRNRRQLPPDRGLGPAAARVGRPAGTVRDHAHPWPGGAGRGPVGPGPAPVPMDDRRMDARFPVAEAARRLEVFLDYLLFRTRDTAHLLVGSRFNANLTAGERALRDALKQFVAAVTGPDAAAVRRTVAWRQVERLFRGLGFEPPDDGAG
jgi:predicted kinase